MNIEDSTVSDLGWFEELLDLYILIRARKMDRESFGNWVFVFDGQHNHLD